MEKYIYVILTKTSTKIGKLIRLITHYDYNHVSFSLDKDLKEIYSFARYYKNAPLVGGFVVESILRYDSNSTKIKIFKIPISNKTYADIKKYIYLMKIYKNEFLYNTFAAISFIFKFNINIKYSYTCIGFVEHIFKKFDIIPIDKKDFSSIIALDKKLSNYRIFEGTYNDLNINNDWGIDLYTLKKNVFVIFFSTVCQFTRLIYRLII